MHTICFIGKYQCKTCKTISSKNSGVAISKSHTVLIWVVIKKSKFASMKVSLNHPKYCEKTKAFCDIRKSKTF